MKSISMRAKIKKYSMGTMFILPAIIMILLWVAYPLVQTITLSFFEWKGYGPWEFVGISHYIKMFTAEEYFLKSLTNSAIYALTVTAGTILIGFFLALAIDFRVSGWKFYRIVFLLPMVLMSVAASMMWVKILEPNGLLNGVLEGLHLDFLTRAWLGDPKTALASVIVATIWQWSAWPMLFILAGLGNIDNDIYEAAKIDGASTFRRVISITLPLIKNVLIVVFMLQLIYTFRSFDLVWIMTRGGPGYTTEILGTLLYKSAFAYQKFGYASVIAVIMVAISAILAVFYIRSSGYSRRKGNV